MSNDSDVLKAVTDMTIAALSNPNTRVDLKDLPGIVQAMAQVAEATVGGRGAEASAAASTEEAPAAPRRGRPPKAKTSSQTALNLKDAGTGTTASRGRGRPRKQPERQQESETAQPATALKQEPAVPINKSVTPDFIICLEDGKKFKMLKRHLRTTYGLTPAEYRSKWGLPSDYPMTAPNYTAQRTALAKQIGLGSTIPGGQGKSSGAKRKTKAAGKKRSTARK